MKAPSIIAFALLSAITLWPGEASACQSGSRHCPINVRMARGTDTIMLKGTTAPGRDCCTYRFWGRAGQTLYWQFMGPASRMVITYPNGDADGPGIPDKLLLPASGFYLFDLHPNLMADGAYGSYQLTITIR